MLTSAEPYVPSCKRQKVDEPPAEKTAAVTATVPETTAHCGVLGPVLRTYRHAVLCCAIKAQRPAAGDASKTPAAALAVPTLGLPQTTFRGALQFVDLHTVIRVERDSIFHRRQSLCTSACNETCCYACALRVQRESFLALYPSGVWWATVSAVSRRDPIWGQLEACIADRVRFGRLLSVKAVNNVLQQCAFAAAVETRSMVRPRADDTEGAPRTRMLWHGSRHVHPMRIALDPRGVDPELSRGGAMGTASYFSDNPLQSLGFGHVSDATIQVSPKDGSRTHCATVSVLVCNVFVGNTLQLEPGSKSQDMTRAPDGYDSLRQTYSVLPDTNAYAVFAHSQACVAYVVTVQLLTPCFVDKSCCAAS
jgi:hypothetical protein